MSLRPDRMTRRLPTLVVVWRITEHCNLGCPFCGYSSDLERVRHAALPDQVLSFGAVLGVYASQRERDVLVSWIGGEPFTWPFLLDVSHELKRRHGLQIGATTNGLLLDSPAVTGRMVEDFGQLTISVDRMRRGRDEGPLLPDTLRSVLAGIRERTKHVGKGPVLRANTILMRDNIPEFETLCATLAEWGVEELTFNALGGRDRPEFHADHALQDEHIGWLRQELPAIRVRLQRLGLKVLGSDKYIERIASAIRGDRVSVPDCRPGTDLVFIDERGRAAPCWATLPDYGIPITEIPTPADVAALTGRFAEMRRSHQSPVCLDCASTQVFGKFDAEK
ncbi:MAG: radical SAM protein [Acidobacteriota bacterium]